MAEPETAERRREKKARKREERRVAELGFREGSRVALAPDRAEGAGAEPGKPLPARALAPALLSLAAPGQGAGAPLWVAVREQAALRHVALVCVDLPDAAPGEQGGQPWPGAEEGPLPLRLGGSSYLNRALEAVLCPAESKSTAKKRKKKKRKTAEEKKQGEEEKELSPELFEPLLLSDEQLRFNNFPLEGDEAPAGRPHPVVALDCEMVITSAGHELARLSAVDMHGATLLDELVLPPRPVLDYLTHVSGITRELLAGVSTSLEQARARLFELVGRDTVLVGHSLENDLAALRMRHARVVDTSVAFPHRQGPPRKMALKALVTTHLKRDLGRSAAAGHCSVADAAAAMELAALKARRGPDFGGGPAARTDSLLARAAALGVATTLVSARRMWWHEASGVATAADMGGVGFDSPGGSSLTCVVLDSLDGVAAVADALPAGALLVVVVQRGWGVAERLRKQKRAASDSATLSQWSPELQLRLEGAIRGANLVESWWGVVGSSSSSSLSGASSSGASLSGASSSGVEPAVEPAVDPALESAVDPQPPATDEEMPLA